MPKQYDLYIDGQFTPPQSGQYFNSISPADGSVVARVANGNAADVDRAVASAYAAKRVWSEMNPLERGRLLRKLADLLVQNSQHLGQLESRARSYLRRPTLHLWKKSHRPRGNSLRKRYQ